MKKFIDMFSFNSKVILGYFFICLIVLFLATITNKKSDIFFSSGRSSLLNPRTYFNLVSHVFGHSSFEHLVSNFTVILLIGPILEEKYGSLLLLKMMLICAVMIGIVNFIFSKKYVYGSSGILYMFIVLSSFVNIEQGKIPLTFVLICLFYIISEVINLLKRKKDNVSHLGHLVGALCGVLFALFIHYHLF